MLVRKPVDSVLSTLSAKIDNYYGKMFINLIYQIRKDSTVINLLPDLLIKVEESIETGRSNTTALSGERVLSFIMTISPLPIYLFMRILYLKWNTLL